MEYTFRGTDFRKKRPEERPRAETPPADGAEAQRAFAADLQVRLQACVRARDVWDTERFEFERLQKRLADMEGDGRPYETLVDIGDGCFVKGVAEDTTKLFVYVGTGVHVQVTIPEALEIAPRRMALLDRRIAEVNRQIASLTDQLHALLAGRPAPPAPQAAARIDA